MSLFAGNFVSLPAKAAPAKMRVATQVGRVLAGIRKWNQARAGRRAMFALYQMDDHFLRDIGVTRADVDAALLATDDADPSLVLQDRRTSAAVSTKALKREELRMARKAA